MTGLPHHEASSALAAVALYSVPAETWHGVRSHAEDCAECRNEFARFEEAVAELATLIPQRAMNLGHAAGIRSRLLMRARSERDAISTTRPREKPDLTRGVASLAGFGTRFTPGSQRAVNASASEPGSAPASSRTQTKWRPPVRLLVVPFLLLLGLGGVQMGRLVRERNLLRAELSTRTSATLPADAERGPESAMHPDLISAVAGPDVQLLALLNRSAQPVGRVFWNPTSSQWTIVTYNLRQPRQGRVFQLWVTDASNQHASLGTFSPDPSGSFSFQVNHAVQDERLLNVSITEERAGGAEAPAGPLIASGAPAP